ncbi:hypothetical protein SKP08_001947 [Vibrio fluvialis]|nr:hypothetical protein [Vibrio fluvialis]
MMQYTPLQAYELIDNELHRDNASGWSGYLYLNETNSKALEVLVDAGLCIQAAQWGGNDDSPQFCELKDFPSLLNSPHVEKKLYVELTTSSIKQRHIIQKNWDELLKLTSAITTPYEAFYFTDDKKLIDASKNNPTYKAYHSAAKVFSLLSKIADTKVSDTEYVFIYGHALAIPFSLSRSSLKYELDTSVLEELLTNDINAEAKTSLVKEALVRFLKGVKKEDRFSSLITSFHGFATELLISYEQFLKNYTFDKVRKEYQEKKTDYIARLNKVFDDVATKALAVPAGIWYGMNQIEPGTVDSLQQAKNYSTLFICLLLVFLVVANLFGQVNVLKTLKKEYTDLFSRIKTEYQDKISYENAQESTQKEIDRDISDIEQALQDLDEREHSIYCKLTGAGILAIGISMAVFITVMCSKTP